ncbi:LutB/LldF family L-lactate oxidation iron-sulfur protein [Larsenimonas salina]|uniref:LutB/LldF family L-lactate oxidation iron-sulfur protein n=1 Tax=Larsenimonas salina TaxID=1295565 RepID=UPI002072CC3A|nr:LutB/LldF family L-lactate oxidation iron-sulfur protein [Larsenimonas salina]MCM5704733.1 LutB/LldF family L-lactate oxidation iron-sulfur protein [Larsenimonas salina]
MSVKTFTPAAFHHQSAQALSNPQLRHNFRGAMDGLMAKRLGSFDSWDIEALRDLGQGIRQKALRYLPDLLEQLEANCQRNGITVHWAESADDAGRVITELCKARGAQSVIKGKSMVSEEVELNARLAEAGIEALESDLGEYIVQMAEETPSHIIMPAIHKNTADISTLMHQRTGTRETNDAEELTHAARAQLRDRFQTADVGISGVNFAVAETGTLCLVENEGNGRLTTTVPPVHIAITGIEKVVAEFKDVPPLYALLTRSAIGQNVTTYFNMISGPRRGQEVDGPEEVHLVLVDNGRSRMYQDEEYAETLQCIRCGACMNHCPVYTRVGGHTYGTTYPGPIGKILMPHLLGLNTTKNLPTASSLCGACGEVCPVRIPIPKLLVRLRNEAVGEGKGNIEGAGSARRPMEAMGWKLFSWLARHPRCWRVGVRVVQACRSAVPKRVAPWTDNRVRPTPAATSLKQQLAQRRRS